MEAAGILGAEGARGGTPAESVAFQRLLAAVQRAGVAENRVEIAVRTVLGCLTERMPDGPRVELLTALPEDARAFAVPPGPHRFTHIVRDPLDLVQMAAGMPGDPDAARTVVRALMQTLEVLVGDRVGPHVLGWLEAFTSCVGTRDAV